MSEALSDMLAQSGLFVLLAALGVVLVKGRVRWAWLAIALGLFILQDMALSRLWGGLGIDFVDSDWNWEGTLFSTLVLLAIALILFRGRWAVTGITFDQRGPAPLSALAVSLLLCVLFAGAAWWLVPGPALWSVEDIAYQATLPGIEGELFYRGLLLGALDQAFGRPSRILRVPMGWGAAMSAMLFAAAHSMTLSPGLLIAMDVSQSAWLFPAGLVLAWLRNATGSILMPILVFNWANTVFYLI